MNSEERREVAARLREVDATKYIEDPDDIAQALAVCVTPETSYNFADFPPALFTRLADLIDPTCRNIAIKPADVLFCSECGEYVDIAYVENADDYHARYCPNCGCRCVNDGEVSE